MLEPKDQTDERKDPEVADEELRFDNVAEERPSQLSLTCSRCSTPIKDTYFSTVDAIFCSSCRWEAEADSSKPVSGGVGRFGKAFLYGLAAAAAGTLVYFMVLWLSGYEIGLIAIAVGWLVGKAVFAGSGGVGGTKYQLMAVALTYCSICASYAPLIVQELMSDPKVAASEEATSDALSDSGAIVRMAPAGEDSRPLTPEEIEAARPAPANPEEMETGAAYTIGGGEAAEMNSFVGLAVLTAIVLAFSMAAPFLGGFENILGLLIIGFGLFEAWRHSGRRELVFEGPFSAGD